MSDLYLVRHHSGKCPHKDKGQKFLSCKCPLGIDGTLNGRRLRRSLRTRNLDKAYRKLAEIDRPDYREPKSLSEAIEAFKASRDHVAHGTLRNDRRVLRNLQEIARVAGIQRLDQVTVELMDLYQRKRPISALTWTKELATLRQLFAFCVNRKWMSDNPAREIRHPKIKPKPKDPFTRSEVAAIIAASEKIGRGPYERLRARAIVMLLRYAALRVSDVAMLPRDRVRGDRIFLYTQKNGKPVFLPIPPALTAALDCVPVPKGTQGESRYFFWSGRGTTRALVRSITRTLGRVFAISEVEGAHAHRFRHTLATGLLEKGWTTEDVATVLGSSPAIIRKHYAQWTVQRQERISSLAHDVWDDRILSGTEKKPLTVEDEDVSLVDGMGLEPTTPTLRTWCSPS